MKNSFLYFTYIIIFTISCEKIKKNNFSEIEYQKEINFGTINTKDTITKYFIIKNTSSIPLKIKNVKASCGCTLVKLKDSIIKKNESTYIVATYIPKKNDFGKISKSIVIETNTKIVYNVMYLKGIVK